MLGNQRADFHVVGAGADSFWNCVRAGLRETSPRISFEDKLRGGKPKP